MRILTGFETLLITDTISTLATGTITFEGFNKYKANTLFSCELLTKRN